jgi:hypothetical protein
MATGQLLLGNRAVKFNSHHWLLLAGLRDYMAVLEIVMGGCCAGCHPYRILKGNVTTAGALPSIFII